METRAPNSWNATRKLNVPVSVRSRVLRVAVVFFGESGKLDGRDMKKKGTPSFDLVAHYNNHARYVFNPIRQAGVHIDVLAQDGTVPTSPTLLNLYTPCAISHIKTMNIFESQEAAVKLQRDWEELHGMSHNWVVLMRWDIMFFSAIDLRQLNPGLFYSVVWCEESGVAAPYVPRPLPGFPGRLCKKWGVTPADEELGGFMDFIFISRPALMETVFVNLTTDFVAHRFNQSGRVECLKARGLGVCAHSLLGDRIKHLVHRDNLRIGRYLIHGLDYSLRRNVPPAEEDCMHRGLHRIRSRDNVTVGNGSLVWAEQPWSTAQCQTNRGIGGCVCRPQRSLKSTAMTTVRLPGSLCGAFDPGGRNVVLTTAWCSTISNKSAFIASYVYVTYASNCTWMNNACIMSWPPTYCSPPHPSPLPPVIRT